MLWPNIALSYMNVFKEDIGARDEKKLPKLKLTHLMRMTDRFGVIQFSNHTAPDKASGYTLDDNSRALIVCCRRYKDRQSPVMLRLIRTYLNFISYVQAPDGKLYNHVDHDRKINMQHWSRDAHGRAVWALGYLISRPEISQDLKQQAEETFRKALAPANGLTEPRPAAFMILGLYLCNAVRPARQIRNAIQSYADLLVSLFKSNSQEDWEWFESNLTYSNSKLPEALLFAYDATKNQEYLRVGKRALDFLISITFEKGTFVPVGQNGWYFRNGQRASTSSQLTPLPWSRPWLQPTQSPRIRTILTRQASHSNGSSERTRSGRWCMMSPQADARTESENPRSISTKGQSRRFLTFLRGLPLKER